jgi:hypothetical protein
LRRNQNFERLNILSLSLIDALSKGETTEAMTLLDQRGQEIDRLNASGIKASTEEFDELMALDAEVQAHLMMARQQVMHEMAQLSKRNASANAYRKPSYSATLNSA